MELIDDDDISINNLAPRPSHYIGLGYFGYE